MFKTSQSAKLLIISILLMPTMGFASHELLFGKPGVTIQEFNRDRYDCVRESRVSWAGGGSGTGTLGETMILASKTHADRQAAELFKMCMEARGYTWCEVSNEVLEDERNLNPSIIQLSKEMNNICNKEDFKLIFIKTPCKADNITLEQLSDKNMISESEKSIFSAYHSEIEAWRKRRDEAFATYGGPQQKDIRSVFDQYEIQSDKNLLDLLEKRIPWGEFNKVRKDIVQKIHEEVFRIYCNK